MANRPFASTLGLYAFGLAAILLGIVGLVSADFAVNWQHVGANVPHRAAIAYITAILELFAGLALLWRRTARPAALVLIVLYSVFTLLWVRGVLSQPQVYDNWGNVFEELSLVIGGVVAYISLAPDAASTARAALAARFYGVCPISFGLVHLIYLSGAASWVPVWLPPGQRFWTIATAVFFFLAAAAILTGILAGLAARWLTAMILVFEILIWFPKLIAAPRLHFNWSGNAINLAIAAATWVVADALTAASRRKAAASTPDNVTEFVA